MPLTRAFRDTVKARADRDPVFRAGLYQEAIQAMLDGDLATGRLLLRDFINATVGFAAVAARMGVHEKSVMRMVSGAGNPQAANLFALVQALKGACGLALTVHARPTGRGAAHAGAAEALDAA